MGFSPQFWKKKKPRRSVFGGEVKSQEEVQALNQRIEEHERKEMEAFEKEFEKASKRLWK